MTGDAGASFHQAFPCGAEPPLLSGGKDSVDKAVQPLKSFSAIPPLGEGQSARPRGPPCRAAMPRAPPLKTRCARASGGQGWSQLHTETEPCRICLTDAAFLHSQADHKILLRIVWSGYRQTRLQHPVFSDERNHAAIDGGYHEKLSSAQSPPERADCLVSSAACADVRLSSGCRLRREASPSSAC